jgi:lysine 2,3-aminomutase
MKTEPDAWPSLIRNSVKNIEELAKHIELTEEEKIQITDKLPLRITEYYLDLIKKYPVLRKTVIPTLSEFKISDGESNDPLKEEGHNPTKCIVHKYPDRALFLVTNFCSTNCRYCTRSRIFEDQSDTLSSISKRDIDDAINYITEHKELRDIIISGGDPLTLSDGNLDYILQKIRAIKHIEIIRIGTKMPVVLPQRITTKLINILKKYHPLYMSIHFTHPLEITPECSKALNKIANVGIVMRSQTVLLKGVNDDVEIMKNLMHKLLINRVTPYYIYNTDYIIGSEHFRCSIDKGLEIIKGLRGFTSGYAIPSYVVDTEHGKIILNPDTIVENNEKLIRLKSYTGKIVEIKKPPKEVV